MINTPERIQLPTIGGERVEIDCNWTDAARGEFVKLRIEDKEAIVPVSSLARIVMWLAKEEEQDAMIPTKSVKIRQFSKVVTIRLKKDMRAGDKLSIPVKFDVPLNAETMPILPYS